MNVFIKRQIRHTRYGDSSSSTGGLLGAILHISILNGAEEIHVKTLVQNTLIYEVSALFLVRLRFKYLRLRFLVFNFRTLICNDIPVIFLLHFELVFRIIQLLRFHKGFTRARRAKRGAKKANVTHSRRILTESQNGIIPGIHKALPLKRRGV